MAIYHFSVKVISRANGSSAVAAAAYRSGLALDDERLGRAHDFSNKAGIVHSEILLPEGAPGGWADRATLWNAVEAFEKRKDAQLAREVEFALPRQLDQAQGVALARAFVQREFVERGMVADLNIHWDIGSDGQPKPHAHVMLSLRSASAEGFGPKVRDWNDTALLRLWRESWANHVNLELARLDLDLRIDHRSFKDQGLALEPQHKIGPAGMRRDLAGEEADRAQDHRDLARRNGEAIIANPAAALEAITQQQSTFTDRDLARFIHRHSDGKEQFDQALSAVRTSPDCVALGKDRTGRERFSSRAMLAIEERLAADAEALGQRRGHGVSPSAVAMAGRTRAGDIALSEGQELALQHVTAAQDLALVVGFAGSGKSTMLAAARHAWEAQGYQVRGAALSGIAAEGLEGGSGITSRTIASLEHAWARDREGLTAKDVLVIDEAGMIGSRQMQRVIEKVRQAGAKLVLVGDAEQLQAIEAGAAFRALTERHGAAEISQIQRQVDDWQRAATRELATGRTQDAIERYEVAGMVDVQATREDARKALVATWARDRQGQGAPSQIILAHTRADVAQLNTLAREALREQGALGEDRIVKVERGERALAVGDRLMFLRNERGLGVKNGTQGILEAIDGDQLTVRLEAAGPSVAPVKVDLKVYNDLDHGYAATIHKSQGVTVDRAYLLATSGLDRHATYVGLSRHRQSAVLAYGAADFSGREDFLRTLGRERAKDITLDYQDPFGERREASAPLAPKTRTPSIFAGFKPAAPDLARELDARADQDRDLRAYVKAFADIQGPKSPLHQQIMALEAARMRLEARPMPGSIQDLGAVLTYRSGLIRYVEKDGGADLLRAAWEQEPQLRKAAELEAAGFVQRWKGLAQDPQSTGLTLLADLERKPRVTAALEAHREVLGLSRDGPPLIGALTRSLDRPLTRSRDMKGPELGD